jgi:hypothetical protein
MFGGNDRLPSCTTFKKLFTQEAKGFIAKMLHTNHLETQPQIIINNLFTFLKKNLGNLGGVL